MNILSWSKNMLKDAEAQKLLEEKVEVLVETYFAGKSDYAIEKFIKSFGEGIIYLENTLLMDRGIHPKQVKTNLVELSTRPDELVNKMTEVTNILKAEINRQSRHYTTFLSEF